LAFCVCEVAWCGHPNLNRHEERRGTGEELERRIFVVVAHQVTHTTHTK